MRGRRSTGEVGAWWGHVPERAWEDCPRERQQSPTPESAREQMEPIQQDGERHIAPVGGMSGQAAGQGEEAPAREHEGGNGLHVEASAPHAPPDPQESQRPETHEPHPSIVGAHQDHRQGTPEHGQGQTAHCQGASE